MTVPSEVSKAGPYPGNNVTVVFGFGFKIVDASHIIVIVRDAEEDENVLQLNTDYTVSGVGDDNGGSITTTVPLPIGHELTILRNVPFVQETDWENQGEYYAETVEDAFDLAVMRDQQLKEELGRAVKMPENLDPSGLDNLVADIIRLGASANNIDTVANIAPQVVTVAGIDDEVVLVAGIHDKVTTVAGIAADVSEVAAVASDIPIVAANVADITNFADVYYGASAVEPTTRRDGSPLQAGDLYFDTGADILRYYDGTEWRDSTAMSLNMVPNTFVGDGVTTGFNLGAAPGVAANVIVWLGNGAHQKPNVDYTVSGSVLSFTTPPGNGVTIDTLVVATVSQLYVPAAASVTDESLAPSLANRLMRDVFVWPEQFGAQGDGVTDDTQALRDMLVAARSTRAAALIPAKTYRFSTLTVESDDCIVGVSQEKSVIKLLDGVNNDLILGKDAYALWNAPAWGNFEEGANRVTIENLTLDGNRENNTAGAGLFLWGYRTNFRNLNIKNCASNAMWTAFWDGNLPMEGTFENILIDTCGENGWLYSGPHDGHVSNVRVVDAGQKADNIYDGIALFQHGNNGTNGRFLNCHSWHRSTATNRMRYAASVGSYGGSEFLGCHFEGGRRQLLVTSPNNRFIGCAIYAPFGPAGAALVDLGANANQFLGCRFSSGDGSITEDDTYAINFYNNAAGNIISGCYFSGFKNTPFQFSASGGENQISACAGFTAGGGLTTFAGTPASNDAIDYVQGGTFINYRKPAPYGAYANDAGAASGGVPVGGLYRNSTTGALTLRVS